MIIYEINSTSAADYFAAEDHIMQVIRPTEPALMFWSTAPTVMLGANQIAEAEYDKNYTDTENIEIVRRRSGGGAIFTDEGALQVTVILPFTPSSDPNPDPDTNSDMRAIAIKWLAEPLAKTLKKYNITATFEGRNDVVIEGKKISGLAQHISHGYICSHASILYSTDLEKLTKALTPSPEKLQKKGIASVRARVTNISDHLPASHRDGSCGSFREALIKTYTNEICATPMSVITKINIQNAILEKPFI